MTDDGWGRPDRSRYHVTKDHDREGWGKKGETNTKVDAMKLDDPSALTQADAFQVSLPVDHVLPRTDGVPLAEINQLYFNETGLTTDLKKMYFTVMDNKGPSHDKLFTAVFTWPVSGEHFACGEWSGAKRENFKVGDLYWYKTKKDAMTAAAARALDCFSLRRCQCIDKRPFQRCQDPPYLYPEDAPPLPDFPPTASLPKKLEMDVQCSHKLKPKQLLKEFYDVFEHKLKYQGGSLELSVNLCFTSWSNLLTSPETRFTSVFTCPLTGEKFASGMMCEGEGHDYTTDCMFYDDKKGKLLFLDKGVRESVDDKIEFEKIDFVWYPTKKEAENAAAARSLDCLLFRYGSEHLVNPASDRGVENVFKSRSGFCQENPYSLESTPIRWKVISETVDEIIIMDLTNGVQGFVPWLQVPMEGMLTDNELRSILNDSGDEDDSFWVAFKKKRGVLQIAENMN